MTSLNTFKTLSEINIDQKKYFFFDLVKLSKKLNFDLNTVPFTYKILLENLLRNEDGDSVNSETITNFCKAFTKKNTSLDIVFYPARVLMQDLTGVPALADLAAMRDALKNKNINPNRINPKTRVDLIIDHSVMVDNFGKINSYDENVKNEFSRNKERYEFLKWGQTTFDNFFLVPPGAGICHQVNLESISQTVWKKYFDNKNFIFPDTLVGTDSHTTMVNALSVLGWGVGGIEAEAVMLGQAISMNMPEVVGFNISGSLNEGITATDLVLHITEKLRKFGVVGKFVEFIGPGIKNLTLADRATISNMSPEYGATCGFFPTDEETLNYLLLSGRSKNNLNIVSSYTKLQRLWYNSSYTINYNNIINFSLDEVKASVAGPKRPQDKVLIKKLPESIKFKNHTNKVTKRLNKEIRSGDIVIAAITSCTNTSNPNVMIAAGLVAKKAVELGLKVKPWVKTSLAPGSKVVSDYLSKSDLTKYLDKIGFNLVGYGCTTCIGNSGPLQEWVSDQITKNKLHVCSVLSGNRNFEGRIHQEIKSNYLASPPLVVAFSLTGNIKINLDSDPIGESSKGIKIFLKDIWPTSKEINDVVKNCLTKKMFISRYKEIYKGDNNWKNIKYSESSTYTWDASSTYINRPPFFERKEEINKKDIIDARILALLSDSVTTDHISPAGAIKEDSPAGKFLISKQISKKNFNSYGSRRGNHEIMMRGTFANIRINNEIVPNIEGGITYSFISNKKMSIFDAAMEYIDKDIPLVIIAGKEYGTGSSRDWAAKGTKLLGIKAVIAESFERIHRSNLLGMGVLPLEFEKGYSRKTLNLKGDEKISIFDVEKITPKKMINCKIIQNKEHHLIKLKCRIDTYLELEYYKSGGILPYVLNSIIKESL